MQYKTLQLCLLIIAVIVHKNMALTQFETVVVAGVGAFGGILLLFLVMLILWVIVIYFRIAYLRWDRQIKKLKEKHQKNREFAARKIQRWYREQIFLIRRRKGARFIVRRVLSARKDYLNKIELMEQNWAPFVIEKLEGLSEKIQFQKELKRIVVLQTLARSTLVQFQIEDILFQRHVQIILKAELLKQYPNTSNTYKHNFRNIKSDFIIEHYWNLIQWGRDPIDKQEWRPLLTLEGNIMFFSHTQINDLRKRYKQQLERQQEIERLHKFRIKQFQWQLDKHSKMNQNKTVRFFEKRWIAMCQGAISRHRLKKLNQAAFKIQHWYDHMKRSTKKPIEKLLQVLRKETKRIRHATQLLQIQERAAIVIQHWIRSKLFIHKIRRQRLTQQLLHKQALEIGSTLYY